MTPHQTGFESDRRLGSAKGPSPDRVQPDTVRTKTSPILESAAKQTPPLRRRSAEAIEPTARLGFPLRNLHHLAQPAASVADNDTGPGIHR